MPTGMQGSSSINNWNKTRIFFITWVVLGLFSLYPMSGLLNASFPIFTVVWLVGPLIVVIQSGDTSRVGFILISKKNLLVYSAINLFALFVLMLAFEPWSHTYSHLLTIVTSAVSPDPTFAWIIRYPDWKGWIGMTIFSGLVTIFAEELFFRGWLLLWLQQKMNPYPAIFLQAALFSLPQIIAALFLPPLQGWLYTFVYSWLAIGVVGGWTAVQTRSIWPGLIGATTCNVILTAIVLSTNG
jgi:membrane protease YdiL (CAAX protease family)